MKNDVGYAEISAKSRPHTGPNGEDAEIAVHFDGSANDLLNVFAQIAIHLVKELTEAYDFETAMNLYAMTQMTALAELGVTGEDDDSEDEE